jgi:hypothetical protein
MKNIENTEELKAAIQMLTYESEQELILLKDELSKTLENIKPLNVLKASFKELTTSPEFKKNVISTTLGLTLGYISKAVLIGYTTNPIKQIVGDFLQLSVSNIVSKNTDTLKKIVGTFSKIFSHSKPVVLIEEEEDIAD